jgi:hypothetical protein
MNSNTNGLNICNWKKQKTARDKEHNENENKIVNGERKNGKGDKSKAEKVKKEM